MKTQKLIGWLIATMVVLKGTCAYATVYSGKCGENLTWTLNTEDSTLVISGHGAMSGMCFASQQFRDVIKNVVFPDGLTSICDYAFLYCATLRHLELFGSLEYIPDCLCYDRAREPRVTGYGDTGTPSFRQNSGQTVPKRTDYHHPWREEIHTDRI